jgi:hypothetical protein
MAPSLEHLLGSFGPRDAQALCLRPRRWLAGRLGGLPKVRFFDMLRTRFAIAGLSAAALAFALAACGGSESSGTGGGGAVDQKGAQPPDPGPQKAADGSSDAVFAISKLYLGDTDRTGKVDANAWKKFGYNLDNKISTKDSKDLCKPAKGGVASKLYPDGDNGIDNSFGHNLFKLIQSFAADASTKVNDSIAGGAFTVMLDLEKLGADGDYNPISAKLYGGADLGAAPKWDGTDQWPLINELLNNGDKNSPKVTFPNSYLVGNTWVSGSKGTVSLNLGISGYTLSLDIADAVITMDLADDHKTATNGTIAGVLDTEGLIEQLRKIAGNFDTGLCEGSTFDSIADQIRQSSDIMRDGSQDPAQTCDGISIGLGFDASVVQLGDVAPPSQPKADPCAAGGGGAGGGI